MEALSQAPNYIREFAHLRATFPLRLWIAGSLIACALTGLFPSATEEDPSAALDAATTMSAAAALEPAAHTGSSQD